MRLRFGLVATFLLSGVVACTVVPEVENSQSATSHITDIPQTSVMDQGQTGNCWLYSTAAWVESLHTQATGESVHYSPAYWLYWELYDQLVGGTSQVSFGGFWGLAGDIINRYGLMPMGDFTSDDVNTALTAVDTLNTQLGNGTIFLNNRDPASVRAILDDAFQLSADMRAELTSIFGADGATTFQSTATPAGSIVRAADFSVRGANSTTTLDRLFGSLAPGGLSDQRTGDEAWTAVFAPHAAGLETGLGASVAPGEPIPTDGTPIGTTDDSGTEPTAQTADANPISGMPPLTPSDPTEWRAFYKRVQRALNDGFPLPMAFSVIFPAIGSDGHFRVAPQIVSSYGGHEVLITDYEITNVPGFGTLAAGTIATDDQKQASLDDNAQISFIRVKNSWGTSIYNASLAGYNDIDVAYLDQPTDFCASGAQNALVCQAMANQIWDIVLPPGY